jgi:hypothetical protein
LRQLTDLGDHGEWNSNPSEAIARRASFESVLMMKSDAKTPSVTVGIFDHVQDLERAVERLAAAGFEDTLYDEAILALDAGDVAPVGRVPIPVLAPGVVVTGTSGSVEPDLPTIVRAFKLHLAEYHLPDQVIEDYAMAFYQEGKVVLVRTLPQRVEEVVRILRECGVSQVNRFD